ncbi:hypothetical protein Bxe_C0703 [Paraburkholderia xenovorans LB400]|uniref:Uncharacterized protein n=1 Tax=Paraburkholderia xenovorans (strain LB400) TaxID=266265 RepID=Q13GX1_PARXL|nr:hypothetical protein Bxe_C0703 [Paraburkholderia xenovorans LB400]
MESRCHRRENQSGTLLQGARGRLLPLRVRSAPRSATTLSQFLATAKVEGGREFFQVSRIFDADYAYTEVSKHPRTELLRQEA